MATSIDSKVPVPTDNIFKFYALFSLLVLVFALGAVIYTNRAANELAFSTMVEIETMKQDPLPSPSQKMRLAALQRQLEISQTDRKFYLISLSLMACAAAYGIYYGFRKWHTEVQPVIDENARVQLEIAKLQLEKMRREAGKPDASQETHSK